MFEYLIRNVSVYCEDKRVLPHQTVAVQDGRIAGVGRDLSGEAHCVIDGPSSFSVLCGHAHAHRRGVYHG